MVSEHTQQTGANRRHPACTPAPVRCPGPVAQSGSAPVWQTGGSRVRIPPGPPGDARRARDVAVPAVGWQAGVKRCTGSGTAARLPPRDPGWHPERHVHRARVVEHRSEKAGVSGSTPEVGTRAAGSRAHPTPKSLCAAPRRRPATLSLSTWPIRPWVRSSGSHPGAAGSSPASAAQQHTRFNQACRARRSTGKRLALAMNPKGGHARHVSDTRY